MTSGLMTTVNTMVLTSSAQGISEKVVYGFGYCSFEGGGSVVVGQLFLLHPLTLGLCLGLVLVSFSLVLKSSR